MAYFNTRDIAAIALCATLWGVLNTLFAPVFFRMFGLPFLCDIIGFSVLILGAWWIRKFGAITLIGIIATAINFALGGGIHFLGFTIASIFFDFASAIAGYERTFKKMPYTIVVMMSISVISAALAGYIIGLIFLDSTVLARWGGALIWSGLHASGGVIGGAIGTFLVLALKKRKITVQNQPSKIDGI